MAAKKNIGKDLIFIMADETRSATDANVGYIAASFAYISADSNNAIFLKQIKDRKKLGILTKGEFYRNLEIYLLEKKIIVVDNSIFSIEDFLYANNSCQYKINQLKSFTEFTILKCRKN